MKKFLVIVLCLVILLSGFTVDFHPANAAVISSDPRGVVFYDDQKGNDALDYIKTTTQDDSFKKIRKFVDLGFIKLKTNKLNQSIVKDNLDSNDSLAIPVESLRGNMELRENVKDVLNNGNTVYLYGDQITLMEYEQLLGITGKLYIPDDRIQEFKTQSTGTPQLGLANKEAFNVIGYNLNGDVFLATTPSENNGIRGSESMYFRAILDNQIKILERQRPKQTNVSFLGIKMPFVLIENTASAASTSVTSTFDRNTYVYDDNGTTVGLLNTDWFLYREYNESDATYDWFTVETNYEATGYNGYNPYEMNIKHNLPYSPDGIYDWKPGDTSSQSAFTIAIPWSIEYQFSTSSSIAVNEQGSQTYDYGAWVVSHTWNTSHLPNPVRFKPATAWLSTGTLAAIDSDITISFSYDYTEGSFIHANNQLLSIRYDY
ncbi:MAG: hypothetical protein QMD16_10730 [Desulfitobacteriaceae bacterium]|nr:hypothetical protein [Desulfitobacteriaceae bacterium]